MSSTLRAIAVAGCTATLISTGFITGVAPSVANPAPAFTVKPTFGPVGAKVTLTGATFSGDNAATINGVSATSFTVVSAHKATLVVPSGATTGPVVVTDGTTSQSGPNFSVQQPTTGAALISATSLHFATPLTVTGTLTKKASSTPVAGQLAALQHRVAGSNAWTHVKGTHTLTTGAKGRVSWVLKPAANGKYRIHFRASHSYLGVTTSARSIKVSPRFQNRSIHTVPVLSTSQIKGTIHPHVSGVVYLQVKVNGKWQHAGHQMLVAGHYSFSIQPKSYGKLRYRLVWRSDGVHSRSISKPIQLQVVKRQLALGDTGPDVHALLKRLRALHYDTGPVSSSYGTDALHAVTAFEKVNGLTKNGIVTTAVWNKLNHPTRPHLRHPDSSAALSVEVNKKKQILMLAKYGKIWRILDTSTAGGYLYTDSEGQTERAETPDGHFTIQYKLIGWHKSKLGELYYPSYFTNTGYAIHGEGNGNDGGEVPPYAASHGCVRITNNAVLRYYNMLTVGTSVWIYG
jgi:L,D-transpeptidase catalytic domain/Putative peptidoglycan binding domain